MKPLAVLGTCGATALLALGACSQEQEPEGAVSQNGGEFAEANESATETPASAENDAQFGIDARPVRIGLDGPEFDACGSFGTIKGLNPDGDNFLSVRSAPSTDAEELDRLTSGTGVSICENADDWIGVVYEGSGAAGTECGVGSPVKSARDYDGACRSGWVSERFVELIAG